MTLTEQIYAQALVLSQDQEDLNLELLEVFCRAAENGLARKLRPGLTPEDCKGDFIAAASLYALAAVAEMDEVNQLQKIDLGDLKLTRGGSNAASCTLRYQAQTIMQAYLRNPFSFVGV